MKQVFIKKGNVFIDEVPSPNVKSGFVKIEVYYSAISSGTEITSIASSGKSMFKKAFENPSKVVNIINTIKNQGLKNANRRMAFENEKVASLGYSIAGVVIEVGTDIDDSEFKIGDFVAAGGSGFAIHANMVVVPKNLVVKIPEGVDLRWASIATVGSISLHGVRRANLKIQEFAVVFGVGLLGLITLQILKASGVNVACIDISSNRLNIAKELGADLIINGIEEDSVTRIKNWTDGYGADAVIFTASTADSKPLSNCFKMCRKKGKVVLVGVSGMTIDRSDIYRDEIDFLISTSYGPGRYDDNYEIKGCDYPYHYVRWTENRNIKAFLDLIKNGKIDFEKLKPRVYLLENAKEAYDNIAKNPNENILNLIEYNHLQSKNNGTVSNLFIKNSIKTNSQLRVGLIGAGSFAASTLLPILYKHSDKFILETIVNNSSEKSYNLANHFQFNSFSNEPDHIFSNPNIDLVIVSTRHDSHSDFILRALKNGKNVFVEKPLAISLDQLDSIKTFFEQDGPKPILMVGFNRRFSPYAKEIRKVSDNRTSGMLLRYRMNAGFIPYDSWVHEHGGRIVGEACHLIDLFQFLTDSEIVEYSIAKLTSESSRFLSSDNRTITFNFKDGSIGSIDYFTCGNTNLPKEYLEVHFDNKSIIMSDYKEMKGFGVKLNCLKTSISQKGHEEEITALYDAINNNVWPIALESLLHTTKVSILSSF